MTTETSDATHDADKEALQHSWNWFSMHAAQRMQVISYFLIAFALIVAGYGTSMQAENHVMAVGIAVSGFFITLSFLLLESRTRELVQAAEPALAALEERLAVWAALPELKFVVAVDKPDQKIRKYSFVIRALMWVAVWLMVVAAVAAVADANGTSNPKTPEHGPTNHRQ